MHGNTLLVPILFQSGACSELPIYFIGLFSVGFSSYLTADLGISNGQKIRFDSTLYNYGNFYSTYSGIFTCPYDGVYLFNYFIGKY